MKIKKLIEKIKEKKRGEEIERDLPFAIVQLKTRMGLGEGFEESLEKTADSVKGALGAELKKMEREIRQKGASVGEALQHSIERVDSLSYQRTCSQLASLHEQGFSRRELSSLGSLHSELISEQKTKLKEFSGKMAVLSLLFVAFSTVLPALFLAFILVGSLFLELDIAPLTAFSIVILGFPAVDIAVLLFIRERTPCFARS